ncbi:DNA-directed DNA polymerase [Tanacetum coccineum]|uniref:DNA-directed DNA polymerase n=1 Tax=Tanacetum coccineum TaxID=301880 RepID=A0ABQ4YY95_9ASTR
MDTSRLLFFHFSLKGKAEEWLDRIPPTQITTWDQLVSRFVDHLFPYQNDLWDDLSPPMNVSSISEAMQPIFRGRLKRACNQISYLKTPAQKVRLKNPYLIYDYCGGSHEADECKQNDPAEQVCLSEGDIYDDPSLLRFYQNDDTPP